MLLGHELAAITAGVDRLYRTTPRGDGFLNKEGLIPVAVANVEPLSLRSYAEAAQALHDLALRLPGEAESELRRAYLAEMIDSLLALVTTFEEKEISFAERLRRQLRVDTQMVPQSVLDGYVRTIREKLDELGYVGSSLAEDLGRWEEDNRVSPDGVLQVLRGYGEEARSRTSALMYDMQQEWLEPVAVQSVPFSAYCDYPARRLLLNLDFPYTRYALKHLACHEAFPGHLVHLALRQRYVAEGRMPLDGAQVVTSSASSALFEGIADNGLFFLDWVDTPDDELAVTLQRLRSALRCNAAWMLHHMNKTLDEIVPVIAEAGFQTEATVRGRLSFLNHGLRAPFVYAYWCGETAVYDVWKPVERERRPEFWHYLYANMHTPETLRTFWKS
ncbi:hypothetical protein [Aminobacter sp. MET-1]|uniref:hypothetical protein n=1 Tax=Aminobacter sp. MET-1 TaxID=2951085 RepID=UPI002269A765|nr:hypothetical protein [Aminobacter sp. MET-1]MCX8569698.1 hypothetical protein [Aminobacter sp. MET-1]